jgi:hypothetical protein
VLPAVMAVLLGAPRAAAGYSVLTHEAIVDAAWERSIAPLLRARFHASAAELQHARAFAYGGSLIQDIGYYPLAGAMFGQLAHYARSGDFVVELIREARTADEEAFALGALAHYVADVEGHPAAVNVAVAMMYPKLGAKYGPRLTYEDDPTAHLRTEFAFDVLQVARGAYLPQNYRDFIGFEISRPLLERAFQTTYGLPLDDVLPHFDLAVGTFRRTVSTVIPAITKVAWATRQKEIERRFPGATSDRFVYTFGARDYEAAWGRDYDRPSWLHRLLSWVLRIVPRVGPFRGLSVRTPTREAERLFTDSFDATVTRYRARLRDVAAGHLSLPDVNLDTGRPTRAGDYRLVDDTYAHWLDKLADRRYTGASPVVRANVLAFYRNPDAPIATKADRDDWRDVTIELAALRAAR